MNIIGMLKMSSETKECMSCHQRFPKTLEYFYPYYKKSREKSYLKSICKNCSNGWNRDYKKAHLEKIRENQRKYDHSPKGVYKKLKASGELTRNHQVMMTQEQFIEWYNSQPKKCYYCGIEENRLRLVSDAYNNRTFRLTVDRMDSSKGYSIENIVLCCLRCNHIKGNFFTVLEMEEIGRKYIARKWNEQNGKETH